MIDDRQKICVRCGELMGEIVEDGQAFQIGNCLLWQDTMIHCDCGKYWQFTPKNIFKTEKPAFNLSIGQITKRTGGNKKI